MTIARFEHTLHTLYIRAQLSRTESPLLKQSHVFFSLLVGFLLFSLGACSARGGKGCVGVNEVK